MGTKASAFQVCNLLSAMAYGYHAGLASYVLKGINTRKTAGVVEPEVVAARRAKGHDKAGLSRPVAVHQTIYSLRIHMNRPDLLTGIPSRT